MTKEQLIKRVNEVFDTYLLDEYESYAKVELYFEKRITGETQHKTLHWGTPMEIRKENQNGSF